jgi:hypothetical protein
LVNHGTVGSRENEMYKTVQILANLIQEKILGPQNNSLLAMEDRELVQKLPIAAPRVGTDVACRD